MTISIRDMLEQAPVLKASEGDLEAMRAQTYRALKACTKAEEAARRAEDEARSRRAAADDAREAYLEKRGALDAAARAAGVGDALSVEWCEAFERREEERRERARARKRARKPEGGVTDDASATQAGQDAARPAYDGGAYGEQGYAPYGG